MYRNVSLMICLAALLALSGCGSDGNTNSNNELGGDTGPDDAASADAGEDVEDGASEEDSGPPPEEDYELDVSLDNLDSAKFEVLRAKISRLATCETAFNDCPNAIRVVSRAERATNIAGCMAPLEDFDGNSSTQRGVANGTILFDQNAARDCLTQMLDLQREDVCNRAWWSQIAACDQVFTGTINDGETCQDFLACESGICERSFDPDNPDDCSGTCAEALPTVGEDEPCGGDTAQCDRTADLICTPSMQVVDDYICVPIGSRQQGEPCSNSWSCVDGLVCDEGECTTRALGEVGDDCIAPPSNSTASSSKPCAAGLACGFLDANDNGTCVELGRQGDPCDDTALCMRGMYCDVDAVSCEPTKGEGEECSSWEECEEHLSCMYSDADTDTCQATPIDDAC